jgi:signal transduction histidine kinase
VDSLLTDAAEAVAASAAEQGVEVIVEPAPPDVLVSGDRSQLRSMLTNLADNAVKYSDPAGGDARVWLRANPSTDIVIVEVEDQGIGISESHIDRIFERFYRVDRARSRTTGGTGLGLSIARHVALTHGGDVSVESKLGEGSIFRVELPRWSAP